MNKDPHGFSGSLEEFEKKQKMQTQTKKGKKNKGNFIIGVIATFIALDAGIFTFFSSIESDSAANFEYWQLLSGIPFFLIIVVAIIASKRNSRKDLRTQIMTIAIVIGIMFFVFAGLGVYFLMSIN